MSKEKKKTITCYNCGSQCEVIKCSLCNLDEWQCSCGYGSGHSHLSDITSNGQSLKEIKKEVDITKLQNQKAIECLMGLRYFIVNLLIGNYDRTMEIICEQIDYDIKELREEE